LMVATTPPHHPPQKADDMTQYADNQPPYMHRQIADYVAVDYDIIAAGEVSYDDPSDMCDPTTQTFIIAPLKVHAEHGADADTIARILAGGFTEGPCGCEHDCCGHRFSSASVRWLTMDRAEVVRSSSRNY
jgi:hypothetical protein